MYIFICIAIFYGQISCVENKFTDNVDDELFAGSSSGVSGVARVCAGVMQVRVEQL